MLPNEISDLVRQKAETAYLDYKAGFEWKRDNRDHQLELLRDMMGMANTQDGGTIVLGVEDGTYNPIGLSPEILASLDQTDIGQMLYRYSEPKLDFTLQKDRVDRQDFVAIRVSEFDDVPILCTDTVFGKDPTKPILRRGAVYIRTAAAQTEEISSVHEMRQLLSRAVLKRGDELLRSIERLITGKPITPTGETIDRYQEELAEADQWLRQVLQKGFLNSARWEVITYPTRYTPGRIVDLPILEQMVKESQVNLRGWPFPYLGRRSETGMFNSGHQAYCDWQEYREGFRLYKSGLFVWKRSLWEDLKDARTDEGKRTLSFISAIYSSTEFLLFIKRLYQSFPDTEHVHISIWLFGCRNRVLAPFDPMVFLPEWYESQEDQISFQQDFKIVDLRASAEEIARRIARHIFHVFNWTDVSEDTLVQSQEKLFPRVKHVRSI